MGEKKKYSLHFLQVNLSCVIPKQEYLVFAHRFIQLELFYFFFNVNGISSFSTLFFHSGSISA